MEGTERDEYEQRIATLFASWQQEIDSLRAQATDRTTPGTVGDERTQVEKLQGQLEMAQVQLGELRSEDKLVAWRHLQTGIEEKIAELAATLARTRAQIKNG
jgi:uncharacterized small protein (DUF1192 family)